MNIIKIGNFSIGINLTPFVVCEAGINHNGKLQKALRMIEVAKKAGANAIKFQTYDANQMIVNKSLKYSYKSQGKKITESMLDIFQRCEFSNDEWFKIKLMCDKQKIMFLSTPQNPSDLDLLLKIGIPAIKIGSDDFTNIHLLKNFIRTKLPLILSCGMATLKEIKTTLTAIGSLKNYPTILMLTTSEYPTPIQNANLLKFKTLSKLYPKLLLGYSDHTQGNLAACIALAFGARVFEKHFTLDKNLPGPDHWFSANPYELKDWIDSINISYELLGSSEVKPTKNESKMKIIARRCPVTLKTIQKNDILDENNVGLRRAGNGLEAKMIFQIYGKKAKQKILIGSLLSNGDF